MYEPDHLRTFLAVAGTLSFTRAAAELGLGQPTVSQHIRKLEASVGRPLFLRDTRTVTLTADGEAMAGFARTILAAQQEAAAYFTGSGLRGRLRFGVSDDLALTALPRILRDFRRLYPRIDLELTVGQSGNLHRRLESGHLDLAFVKHQPGDGRASVVRRDRLIWAAAEGTVLETARPVPLVVYQAPSLSRAIGVRALDAAGRSYRITCTVRGVNGVLAAVRAGLGIAVFARSLAPRDLIEVSAAALPDLGEVDFVLLTGPRAPADATTALTTAILGNNPQLAGRPDQRSDQLP
ncbi:DNA-binding transcriptional regulator, LysR family [Nakamurella panacisegetis]|uniref:DNA-binding transcriptional regulator, LysR family n=1 Tax=Nakamurella panacisegetis TaxID=1090615 RepID=A0A1H0KSP5_9ACTN|nr:LysR substrate-binding domain-containing protein [Nakamurella panacisegetis]SDO58806.1 DNA-binding transcriptional regulator, LysR family [Nakamurella panacisegetis]